MLCLSCAAGGRSLGRAAARYGTLNPASIALTKLDEAEGCGAAVGLLTGDACPAPVSLLAAGQDVPDDLEHAAPARLAAAALGDWEHPAAADPAAAAVTPSGARR